MGCQIFIMENNFFDFINKKSTKVLFFIKNLKFDLNKAKMRKIVTTISRGL